MSNARPEPGNGLPVGGSGAGKARKRLLARYDPARLASVLAFIHAELSLDGGPDVYNIQYDGAVASASATEPVEDVLERIDDDVLRFILPLFRGRARSIRIEHRKGLMTAEAADYESIEALEGRWVAVMGGREGLSYGLSAEGRMGGPVHLRGMLHLVLQAATIHQAGVDPLPLTLEHCGGRSGRTGVGRREYLLPSVTLPCSDCKGYHAPGMVETIRTELAGHPYGEARIAFEAGAALFDLRVDMPYNTYELTYDSPELVKVRDVERLYTRMLSDWD